jgi:maltodextrin utilization protein YvdJ
LRHQAAFAEQTAAIAVASLGALIAAAGSLLLFVLWRLDRDPHLLITSFVVVPAWALGACCLGLAGVLAWRRIGLFLRAVAIVAMVAGGGVLLFLAAAFFSRP